MATKKGIVASLFDAIGVRYAYRTYPTSIGTTDYRGFYFIIFQEYKQQLFRYEGNKSIIQTNIPQYSFTNTYAHITHFTEHRKHLIDYQIFAIDIFETGTSKRDSRKRKKISPSPQHFARP